MSDIPGSSWFWNIIEQGRQDEATMMRILESLDREHLEEFYRLFTEAVIELSGDQYGDVHDYGESKLHDLGAWVVSQGLTYYESVYNDPNLLPRFDDIDQSRSYIGLVERVYSQRFGRDIPFPS